MTLIARLCQCYSILALTAIICLSPWIKFADFSEPLDSPVLELCYWAASIISFAALLFETCFYVTMYVKGDARVIAVQSGLGGKDDTRLMMVVYLVLLAAYAFQAKGHCVQQNLSAVGGPRPVYSLRKLEWAVVVPLVMWVGGRRNANPKRDQDAARDKGDVQEEAGGVVASIVATVMYIICGWLASTTTDPWMQYLFLCMSLMGALCALVEEGIRGAFAAAHSTTRGQATLLWWQVIAFALYGVTYVAAWRGLISPLAEGVLYTFGDVTTKLGHSWVLFAIRQSELMDTVAKAVAEAKTGADDLRNLISNANAPIFALDLDFKVTSWNRKMSSLTGIRQDLAKGRSLLELVASRSQEAVAIICAALQDEMTSPFEVDIVSHDEGSKDKGNPPIKIMMSVTPKRDREGKVIGVVGVGQDMTELTAVRDEEARKARFMAVVAHELRSPLHGIIGLTDSLCELEKQGLRKKQLGMVKNCATRLLDLVVSIMDATSYMEQGAGRKAPRPLSRDQVELTKILSEVVLLVGSALDKSGQPLIRREVSLLNKVEEDLPLIEADAHKCTQVFYNIVTNACKFTVKGRIVISSNVDRNREWVEISIADTGKGIATDSLERIFKPFEQEEGTEARKFEGIGLGLSIVKGVVEQHGGAVRVTSEVGRGSTFTVRLPLRMQACPHINDDTGSSRVSTSDQLPSRVETLENLPCLMPVATHEEFRRSVSNPSTSPKRCDSQSNLEGSALRRRPTILSVDDDIVNQTVIESTLAGDYEIHASMDGAECLEYLNTHSRLPDIVLLDVMMPGLTGFEVCRKIRNELGLSSATLPIIMLSARAPVTDSIVEGLEAGCNDYLSKPFDKSVLHARVQAALKTKRLHQMEVENAKHAELLHSLLPQNISARLQAGENLTAESHDNVTILVTDIVGWTSIKESMSVTQGIALLNTLFSTFDDVTEQYGVHKVETVGDMYMCAAGHDGQTDHASRILCCALEMIKAVRRIRPPVTGIQLQVRVGAHTGPAYTGIVGKKVPRYCFFGEAVEISRRMASHGVPSCVHISDSTRQALRNCLALGADVQVVERGAMDIRGRGGEMATHLIVPPGMADHACRRYQHKESAEARAQMLEQLQEARAAAEKDAAELREAHVSQMAMQRQELEAERHGTKVALSELQQAKQAKEELRAELSKAAAEMEALQEARRRFADGAEAERKLCSTLREELSVAEKAAADSEERCHGAEERFTALLAEHEVLREAHAAQLERRPEAEPLGVHLSRGAGASVGWPSTPAAAPLLQSELNGVYQLYEAKEREIQHLRLELELSRKRLRAARDELAAAQASIESKDLELCHALLDARRAAYMAGRPMGF